MARLCFLFAALFFVVVAAQDAAQPCENGECALGETAGMSMIQRNTIKEKAAAEVQDAESEEVDDEEREEGAESDKGEESEESEEGEENEEGEEGDESEEGEDEEGEDEEGKEGEVEKVEEGENVEEVQSTRRRTARRRRRRSGNEDTRPTRRRRGTRRRRRRSSTTTPLAATTMTTTPLPATTTTAVGCDKPFKNNGPPLNGQPCGTPISTIQQCQAYCEKLGDWEGCKVAPYNEQVRPRNSTEFPPGCFFYSHHSVRWMGWNSWDFGTASGPLKYFRACCA